MNKNVSFRVSPKRSIGAGHPVYIIAEIGINHNGDLNIAKSLIDLAVSAGCDAVKFQKRTIDVVYTREELARQRENPFGPTNFRGAPRAPPPAANWGTPPRSISVTRAFTGC